MSQKQQATLIKNKFHHMLDGMIYLNKHHRSLYPDFILNMGLTPYLLNFGIVTVDVGRQIGKTTYILESSTENDLIICINYTRKKDILHKTTAKVMTYEEAAHGGFIRFSGLTNSYSTIYLDDFSYFKNKNQFCYDLIENLVVWRLLTKDSTIVRLG